MINKLNDSELSDYISRIHSAHCLLDRAMANGEEKHLFLLLKTLFDNADDAMHRLNRLQTEKK